MSGERTAERYQELLDEWNRLANLAAEIAEARDIGVGYRLKVTAIDGDDVRATRAATAVTKAIGSGGFVRMLDLAVMAAETAATEARQEFEFYAVSMVQADAMARSERANVE